MEGNNSIDRAVTAGRAGSEDIRIEVDSATDAPNRRKVTVANEGSAPAEDVLVRIYAGDPSQGGTLIEGKKAGRCHRTVQRSATIELDRSSQYRRVRRRRSAERRGGVQRGEQPRRRTTPDCDTVPR